MTSVNATILTTINKYASSKEETRFYLKGVCLDVSNEGKSFMVATDGHKLLAAPFDNENLPAGQYIVPRELIEKIKPKKKSKEEIEISIDGENVSLSYEGATYSGKLIDGSFPDWRRVIPSSQSGEPARFKGAYLKEMDDAANAVGAGRALIGFNGDNPSWVEFTDSELFGVIMPLVSRLTPDPQKPNLG